MRSQNIIRFPVLTRRILDLSLMLDVSLFPDVLVNVVVNNLQTTLRVWTKQNVENSRQLEWLTLTTLKKPWWAFLHYRLYIFSLDPSRIVYGIRIWLRLTDGFSRNYVCWHPGFTALPFRHGPTITAIYINNETGWDEWYIDMQLYRAYPAILRLIMSTLPVGTRHRQRVNG